MLLVLVLCLAVPLLAAPKNELITSLPGLVEPMRSQQYSGYLNITKEKSLYYWYIESENDPAKDPVVLWLNGGPGCSSLEGLFVEMGPYRTNDFGVTLTRNPWTWNRNASIIYLDAPAGVGFSYRVGNISTFKYTDDEVAKDNLAAIKMWFEKFSERKTNAFYVAGESYGGTYVPMLSAAIVNNNLFNTTFKGVLIGNGCIDDKLNANTAVGFNYNHGFLDARYYKNALSKCCSNVNYTNECDFYTASMDPKSDCYDEAGNMTNAYYYTNLDPYFVYYSCYLNPKDQPNNGYQTSIARSHLRKMGIFEEQELPSCTHYNDSTVYLQRADVRKALNIPDYVPKYESCSYDIEVNYVSTPPAHLIDQHDNVLTIINAGIKVTLFNGDTDSICNNVGNAEFVSNLNRKLIKAASPWTDETQLPDTAGMLTKYEGIDFITIRGGGHFPASSKEKPKETYQMFMNFIQNIDDYSTGVTEDIPYVPPTQETTEYNTGVAKVTNQITDAPVSTEEPTSTDKPFSTWVPPTTVITPSTTKLALNMSPLISVLFVVTYHAL